MQINLKVRKFHVIVAAALLFCFLTGIIFYDENTKRHRPVFLENNNSVELIIDPGHGGADGGALAMDGTKESVINLDIARRLDKLSAVFGIKSIMTRTSEELSYPVEADSISKMKRWDQQRRLELINSTPNAVFISIHQNKYPDPRPFGPQVLYGNGNGSMIFGELCHELLNKTLCPQNRRVASKASGEIYLMKHAECSAILVECGFISNARELELLMNEAYQKKLAAVLLAAYLSYTVG